MRFSSEFINDVAIEKIKLGKATKKEAEEFRKILDSHIENGYKKLVIDLTECDFIDSTFLSVLVWALKEVSKDGGQIILVGYHDEVESLIDVTGMNKVFKSFDSVKTAISGF